MKNMKCIVILTIDPDQVLESHCGTDLDKCEASLEAAIEGELGWAVESGISVDEVICPDALLLNDAILGAYIRYKILGV